MKVLLVGPSVLCSASKVADFPTPFAPFKMRQEYQCHYLMAPFPLKLAPSYQIPRFHCEDFLFFLFKSFCKHYGSSHSSVHERFRAEELSDPPDFKSNACTIYDVHNKGKGNGCAKLFYLWACARLTLSSLT